MKLTTPTIKKMTYRGGWDVRWDSEIPGFGLRVYPSGKKAFVLSYRNHRGKKRLMRLGEFGTALTVDQAREMARAERGKVRQGIDPLDERRQAARGGTLRDLRKKYLEHVSGLRHGDDGKPVETDGKHERVGRERKKTWREDGRRLRSHVPKAWLSRDPGEIGADEVASLHQRIGADRLYEANRLVALLSRMFRLSRQWGMLPRGGALPTDGIEKFGETKRRRWATPAEIQRIGEAIDAESNIYVRSLFWLLLLTGARKNELLGARWADVDWDRKVLRLPDTKSGQPQELALSQTALAILQAAPPEAGNPYIFPGAVAGQHFVNVTKAWHRIRKAAKVEDLRIHDLRRSFGAYMTQAGIDLNVIKEALRHSAIATTLIYARLGQDAPRAAVEEHGKRVMEMAGKAGPTAVGEAKE